MMKDVIVKIIKDYGTQDIRHCYILYGSEAATKFSFTNAPVDLSTLQDMVKYMPLSTLPPSSPHVALEAAAKAFQGRGVRPNATRVLVVLTDAKGDSLEEEIKVANKELTKLKVKVITVGIGAAVDPDEMVKVAGDNDNVIRAPVNKDPVELTKLLMDKVFKPGEDLVAFISKTLTLQPSF